MLLGSRGSASPSSPTPRLPPLIVLVDTENTFPVVRSARCSNGFPCLDLSGRVNDRVWARIRRVSACRTEHSYSGYVRRLVVFPERGYRKGIISRMDSICKMKVPTAVSPCKLGITVMRNAISLKFFLHVITIF